ncbi:threonyl-tRNA synthetase editing domain-containing protein [Acanthopleuribacter pedis]|uniref:Threonyl-tRNA synthetase editing domain-containing protein n=1 Tax=Acanthopleuribacter pedis TaxID=442870 RepID=A0A8J7U0E1_9BACT|nr:threonyl-tRNA synthetase editing domain-containing protein [Acanthopleuribacter pedis]MBO1316983.1 hypothetical protein [Acanthopleuribacter pedis]
MKLLMYMAHAFSWQPYQKTLDDSDAAQVTGTAEEAVVVFLHAEAFDEANPKLVTKLVKHIKWLANKRDLKTVVLHSFAHLAATNADPGFTQETMRAAEARLAAVGYRVLQTPFGYTCAWQLSVYGESLGKVFKEIGPPAGGDGG